LITLLVAAFGVAGCGGDDDEDSGGSGGGASTTESSTEESSGTKTSELSDAAKEKAAKDCKDAVDAQPQLSTDVKKDLQEICEEAAEGDEDAVEKATVEVCVAIVEDTTPAGAVRDQAVAACKQTQ
jgi:flagellar motor protein MotB